MKRNKLLFIYNPHAGKARIRSHLLDLIDIFTKAGFEVTAYPTQKRGDAAAMVEECAKKFDLLVCSGGDGTLDEVVTGMMRCEKKIPLGYVPAGSTNDFANSLKIPKDMEKAAHVITGGKAFSCDVGRFNEDTFVYIAAFGLFTDVSYETNQQMKNVLGHMAYILEGVKRLSSIKSYHVKVTADDRELEGDFLYGMVTNSRSVGGFKNITGKNVELDDGLFEVTLIKRPKNAIELNKIMGALVGARIDTNYMHCFKAVHISFQSETEIPWTLDGEFGGIHRDVNVQNEKAAITFLVP